MAPWRHSDVGQSLYAACAHGFLCRRTETAAARHHSRREAGVGFSCRAVGGPLSEVQALRAGNIDFSIRCLFSSVVMCGSHETNPRASISPRLTSVLAMVR